MLDFTHLQSDLLCCALGRAAAQQLQRGLVARVLRQQVGAQRAQRGPAEASQPQRRAQLGQRRQQLLPAQLEGRCQLLYML